MGDVTKFEREDRYVVIKLKKIMDSQRRQLPAMLDKFASACVDAVVVEQDWPEYNFVWLMLEHRVGGYPVPDFNAVKCAADVQVAQSELAALREELAASNKVGTAIGETLGRVTDERDDLHKRLTAAEQRNEILSTALIKIIEMNRQHAEDQHGDAEKAESWSCITVAREALGA